MSTVLQTITDGKTMFELAQVNTIYNVFCPTLQKYFDTKSSQVYKAFDNETAYPERIIQKVSDKFDELCELLTQVEPEELTDDDMVHFIKQSHASILTKLQQNTNTDSYQKYSQFIKLVFISISNMAKVLDNPQCYEQVCKLTPQFNDVFTRVMQNETENADTSRTSNTHDITIDVAKSETSCAPLGSHESRQSVTEPVKQSRKIVVASIDSNYYKVHTAFQRMLMNVVRVYRKHKRVLPVSVCKALQDLSKLMAENPTYIHKGTDVMHHIQTYTKTLNQQITMCELTTPINELREFTKLVFSY